MKQLSNRALQEVCGYLLVLEFRIGFNYFRKPARSDKLISLSYQEKKMSNPIQSRREFLRRASALGVSAIIPLETALAQSRKVDRVGLQLYTLRQEMAADFEGTLQKVA